MVTKKNTQSAHVLTWVGLAGVAITTAVIAASLWPRSETREVVAKTVNVPVLLRQAVGAKFEELTLERTDTHARVSILEGLQSQPAVNRFVVCGQGGTDFKPGQTHALTVLSVRKTVDGHASVFEGVPVEQLSQYCSSGP